MKLLIIGLPRAGKTTLSEERRTQCEGMVMVIHTDDLISKYEWSVFSDKVCDLLKQPGPWIIEGCSAVRGLRKYLREGNKVDFEVVWLDKLYVPLTGKQRGFAGSLVSIWKDCQEAMGE